MCSLRGAACRGDLPEVQLQLADQPDLHSTHRNGDTAMHLAAYEGHLDVLQELVEAGAGVNVKNKNGQTSLHLSAIRGHTEVVKELLQSGADRSVQTQYSGMTALHLASHNGHLEAVQLLLDSGGDDILDYIGKSAEFYSISAEIREAFRKHRTETVKSRKVLQPAVAEAKSNRKAEPEENTPPTKNITEDHFTSNTQLLQLDGKRRRSRSHSLEKIKFPQEKDNNISPVVSQTKKHKRRKSRSHSLDKVKSTENESETMFTRPHPIQIEESEELKELDLGTQRLKKHEEEEKVDLPPISNPGDLHRKKNTNTYKTKARNTGAKNTDIKFEFSEKHKQHMKQSVFDRLGGK